MSINLTPELEERLKNDINEMNESNIIEFFDNVVIPIYDNAGFPFLNNMIMLNYIVKLSKVGLYKTIIDSIIIGEAVIEEFKKELPGPTAVIGAVGDLLTIANKKLEKHPDLMSILESPGQQVFQLGALLWLIFSVVDENTKPQTEVYQAMASGFLVLAAIQAIMTTAKVPDWQPLKNAFKTLKSKIPEQPVSYFSYFKEKMKKMKTVIGGIYDKVCNIKNRFKNVSSHAQLPPAN